MDTAPPKSSFLKYAAAAGLFLGVLFISWVMMGHRPPNWHLGQWGKTYNKNGVQFSYDSDWRVVERPAKEGTMKFALTGTRLTRIIQNFAPTLNIEGPDGATITLALFEPSYSETLKAYADRMKPLFEADWKDYAVKMDATEPVVGRLHGTNYTGFRFHYTLQPPGDSLSSRFQYFFLLRTPTNKIFFTMRLPEESLDRPDVKLILDSLRLKGEFNPVGLIDYSHVNFEKLEEALSVGCSIAQHASGEDLAVAKAWNHTLIDFITARQPFAKAVNDLETGDLVNVHKIIRTGNQSAQSDQFRERSGIAMAYYWALRDWKIKLNTLHQGYENQLHQFKVDEARCRCELDRMVEGTDSLNCLRAAYDTDQEVAIHYNYTIGAMADYFSNNDIRNYETKLAELDALKLKAEQLRQEYQSQVAPQTANPAGNRNDPISTGAADPASNRNGTISAVPAGKKVGMILYKPEGAVAVIGNKTVMNGDAVDGFKIIAIQKDSVTVQSPSGVKTALRLGDVLK